MRYEDFMTGFAAQFPSENSEEKEERGILGTAADAFNWWRNNGGAQLAFLAGAGAEGLGKLFNALGDNTTLAAKYNPSLFGALRSIGDTSDRVAQGLLKSAANIAPVADKDSYTGQLVNTLTGSFEGGLGNLAGMAGLRKTADAGYQIAQKTANDAPVSLKDGFIEYMTNPRGLAADTGQLLGSMASIVPFMGLVPEAAGARAVGALGGNALERYLIQHGMYDAAKMFAVGAPTAARYGLTSAPAEGLMEGYPVYRDLISRGYSEDDAYSHALATAGKNIPFLVASNTLEGLTLFSPLGRAAGSTWKNLLKQIGARGTINSLQEMFEEGTQEGIQNEQLGKPYSYFPPFWPDSQIDAALHVGVPAALMGAGGGAVQAIRPDVETSDWQRGSDERISAADFGARAEKQGKQHQHENLRAWADKESGGQMSDDVFNSIVRNAQAYGIPVKRAIATAIAENGGKQEGVSPAGAIGVMQLMPSTAQGLGVDPYDTEQNIRGGMQYLKQMYDQYGDWNLAHAAYNAGPGNVTDHVPQNGETEHYVARINGFLSESPSYYKDTDSPSNDSTYLGNNGKAEGRYWVRQGDYVSFDGAQPDLLNAVDILGKMFYDRTGKQLVVTAGTNGDHVGGEHSHGAGWKVDIADAGANGVGMNEDGALFTADYRAQPFLKEFIEFGRSLGLGMNLEAEGTPNVHIDVALDGHQWDGNGEDAGGFSLDRVRKNARGTAQSSEDISTPSRTQETPQTPPTKEEAPKPLFDLNDPKLYEDFANEKRNSSTDMEAAEAENFFAPMFTDNGKFKNTKTNRQAIRDRYGDDFTDWVNARRQNTQPPVQPPQPAPPTTQETPVETQENTLPIQTQGQPQTPPQTAPAPSVENQPVHPEPQPIQPPQSLIQDTQTPQPTQKAENVVQNNQPPENILSSPEFGADENLAAQEPPENKDDRKTQGSAIMRVANFNRVQLPEPLKIAVKNGDTKGIISAQEILREKGLIPAQQPQPQQTETPAQPTPPQTEAPKAQPPQPIQPPTQAEPTQETSQTPIQTQTVDAPPQPQPQDTAGDKPAYDEYFSFGKGRVSGFSYATLKGKESLSANVLKELNALAEDEFAGNIDASLTGSFRFPNSKYARAFAEKASKLISAAKNDNTTSTSGNFATSTGNVIKNERGKDETVPPFFVANLRNKKAKSAVLPLVKKHGGFVNGDYAEGYIFSTPEQRDAFIDEANELINNLPAQENIRPQPLEKSKREQISEKLQIDTHPNIKNWLEERMRISAHTTPEGKEALDELNSMLKRDFTDEELDDMEQRLAPKPPEPAQSNSLSPAELENKVLGLVPTDEFVSDEEILMQNDDIDMSDLTVALLKLKVKGYIEEREGSFKRTSKAPEIKAVPSIQSQEETPSGTQENVTRQEQPAQEDDRDVFDLLPESNELNDVESAESAEQRPTRETPQPAPQQAEPTQETQPKSQSETPAQIEPPKPKAKRSKKAAALHKKFKTDTHPNIGAYLDELIETAASKEKSDERTNAQRELKTYETREAPTDETLDRVEKQLQEEKNAQQEAEREREAREKEAEKALWEKQTERVEKQLWGEEESAKTEQPESAKKNDTDETPAPEEKPAQDSKPQQTETSKPAEKETDEKSAIEELKAKTKAELEEILETDKYPSIQEYLDDSFKNLEYESLEAAQRGRNAVLKDARKMKAENRVAKFAAVRLHRNWVDKVTVADSYDRTLDKKMQSILDKMRDGKITGEEAYEKLDDLLSGRAQKKAKAKRAGKQEKRNQLIQKLKDDLAQILDLDNHPNLKEYLYRGIDLELQKLEAESLKRLKEWCDSQITEAKGIRDKGKIEEWEERAKERLPKPQSKPQPDTQKTAPAREETKPKSKPKQKVDKGKWHIVGSAGSRENLQKLLQKNGFPFEIRDDGTILNTNDGRIFYDSIRINNGRWQYGYYDNLSSMEDRITDELKENPELAETIEQLGAQVVKGRNRFYIAADAETLQKINDYLDTEKNQKSDETGKADITGAPNIDTSNVVAEKDLTPAQKLLVSFGKKLGVEVVFFNNPDGRFRGVHKGGKTFLNINGNKELGGVFWHESFHWLKNNNPELYKALVKAAGITDAQRRAYLETSKRTDLKSNEEIDEEILADMMDDVAKRTGLFQSIAGKNRGLIERVIQWFKDTLNKFIDHFRNPQGKLTTAQAQALANEFGRIANQLKDPNGNQIFRYNRRTHNVELADGRDLANKKEKHPEEQGAFLFWERPRITFALFHPVSMSIQGRIQAQENSGTTQVSGTKTMYVKALQHLRRLKNDITTVLDYGAGLGLGTDAMRENNPDLQIDSHEPNPQRWQGKKPPTFTDNTKIKSQYDAILNTNVLNVVEPEIRRAIVRDIGSLLNVGGKALITTRSWRGDIEKTKNYTLGDEPHSMWIPKTVDGKIVQVYQKGFDGNELVDYVSEVLGSNFKVEKVSGFGKSGVIVTRLADNTTSSNENYTSKFSIGSNDNKPSFFSRAWNKFAKAAGLDGDRIVTEEDRRRAHLQAQEKAMAAYLKEPTKDNMHALKQLGVTKGQLDAYMNGEEYAPEIGLIQNYRGSPSRIADKNAVFRAFFNMGDRAMDKLVKLRDSFANHYGRATALVKNQEDREQLVQLLWDGDEEQKEFTKEELLQDGVKENVADAYLAIRRQMRRAYTLLDEARRRPQSYAKYLTNAEYERLRDNKFVKQGTLKVHDKQDDKGNHLVTWTEYANQERTYKIDGSARARFLADDAIQILEEKQLPDGTYEVTVREGIPKLTDREGYIPHFFHEYTARVRDADGKQVGAIIGTGRTQREAIKLAEEWQKNNTLKDGEQIHITPHTFNFGMDENYAPIMGDKDFEVMMNRIAKNTGTTLAEAQQIVKGAVKLKNRHRFLGQLLKRKGYAGYEKDMDWVLRHHFNTVARYVALETEFKPKAISLFERVFGAFDKDHSKNLLAKYTKDYINDVNGVPAWIDEVVNKTLNQNSVWRKYFMPNIGERGFQRIGDSIASINAYLKLGMFNISSAMINFTQLINAAGYVGWAPLMKHFGQVVSRKGNLTLGEMRILNGSGVLQDIGLDTAGGYDKNRGYGSDLSGLKWLDWLGNKSMIPFQKCDMICRISTALAAYDKAVAEGKSRAEALAYAKKVNRDANFSYGIEDAPNLMRRTSTFGKVALQFYKYPLKQFEVMADFLPQNEKTTFKQKMSFWLPYFLACGLTGIIPFFDWGDDWLNKHFGLFPKDFMQRMIMELSNGSEAERMIAKVIMYGAPALANIDVSKRTGMASLVTPNSLLGAAGGTVWGVGENVVAGNYTNALRSFSPGLFNIYMAAVGGETHNARGRKLSAYEDAYARLIRGLGFTSVDESVERDINRISFNAQSERTKLEQRAIDAYIADETPENRRRLEELGISTKRVKDERRKKKLGILERRQENIPKKRRRDYEELFKFAQ